MLTNAHYGAVTERQGEARLHVIRNPLSVILSAYHSHLATHPTEGWAALAAQRAILSAATAREGMLLTLPFLLSEAFFEATPGPLNALQAWNYDDERFQTLRMEDLTRDVEGFLTLIRGIDGFEDLSTPAVEEFQFQNFTGRAIGEVDNSSHYRSGDANAWRSELPPIVIEFVRSHFRPMLERFYPDALSDRPPAPRRFLPMKSIASILRQTRGGRRPELAQARRGEILGSPKTAL